MGMGSSVDFAFACAGKLLATDVARIRILAGVDTNVNFEIARVRECFVTEIASIRSFTGVSSIMQLKCT